jgi:hypothetical protein
VKHYLLAVLATRVRFFGLPGPGFLVRGFSGSSWAAGLNFGPQIFQVSTDIPPLVHATQVHRDGTISFDDS